jgi:hypothetical protein
MAETSEIFEIKARRCSRCGGILTSKYGLQNGMGHSCKQKYDAEHAPLDENQMTMFEDAEEMEKKDVRI